MKSTMLMVTLLLGCCTFRSSGEKQAITWVYANDLERGASFFLKIGLLEIENLIQQKECRIFRSTNDSGYLGVCNTRSAPKCSRDSQGDAVPVTITLIFESRNEVDTYVVIFQAFVRTLQFHNINSYFAPEHRYHNFLKSQHVNVTETGASKTYGAYSFNFYDDDYLMGLGCYRFEAQSFDDPAFPSVSLIERLRNQLKLAGTELRESPQPSKPISCACEDFCSGQCFAPSCDVCDAGVWSDESRCLNPGPLGQGLLCAQNHTQKSSAMPCCSPNGNACRLDGGQWCNCSSFPVQDPLFPPLSNDERAWNGGRCVSNKS